MFKTLITLMRGTAAEAGETLADRNALLLLDQQMRDAAAATGRARRALALALAQDGQEGERLAATFARIADLETRVRAALTAGDEAAAREGAEAIAALEAERDASCQARAVFAAETARLRAEVRKAGDRLSALDRGRRIARAAEAARDMRKGGVEAARPHEATLSEAEATLERLRRRQAEAVAADAALDDADTAPAAVAERLAGRGYGPALRASAESVLARLRATPATSPA